MCCLRWLFLKRDFRVVFPFGGFVVGSAHIVADQGHGFLEGGVAEGVPAFLPAFVFLAVFQHFVDELRQQCILHAGSHPHVFDDIFIGVVPLIVALVGQCRVGIGKPGLLHLPPRNGEAVQIQRACKTACGRIVGPAGVGRWSCKTRNGNCEENGAPIARTVLDQLRQIIQGGGETRWQ